jgi:hypothetical protein
LDKRNREEEESRLKQKKELVSKLNKNGLGLLEYCIFKKSCIDFCDHVKPSWLDKYTNLYNIKNNKNKTTPNNTLYEPNKITINNSIIFPKKVL